MICAAVKPVTGTHRSTRKESLRASWLKDELYSYQLLGQLPTVAQYQLTNRSNTIGNRDSFMIVRI